MNFVDIGGICGIRNMQKIGLGDGCPWNCLLYIDSTTALRFLLRWRTFQLSCQKPFSKGGKPGFLQSSSISCLQILRLRSRLRDFRNEEGLARGIAVTGNRSWYMSGYAFSNCMKRTSNHMAFI